MTVEIITPEKKLFEGETSMVKVPGAKGSFQMLNMHAPIVSTLDKGEVVIREMNDNELKFSVNGGLVECKNNKIVILVEE
ncbi:MAG: ATP synthase F1 subunit epsilon [Bacteroidales bacterium]|jgi:F-type H+-transporting ATPase subunit epsilon|nr:ATP synthase F1 subunit epsilon [Bacteroidales bacterium]MBQ1606983.1 ATP synthase F1 subunit epsilon [Bacteroidales bacterium]MBQ1652350.1 ATP synthase F1 subunit epsilon [Bacteroidales bacterium]MBQ1695210.1 ATP synthase F1 subunit epsilon [Bacteroidales bacterium]MBQ1720139.1 ATP synthase F1 subunit epsilon [Bacteroidales bacterium]